MEMNRVCPVAVRSKSGQRASSTWWHGEKMHAVGWPYGVVRQ